MYTLENEDLRPLYPFLLVLYVIVDWEETQEREREVPNWEDEKKKDTHTQLLFLPLPLHQEAATVCFLISEEILLFIWKKTSFPSLEGD